MRVILALAALLLVAVPSVLGQCADNTDATTGVEFLGVANDGDTSTADCPGGVGQATRLCTAGAFEAPDYSACRCAEEVVGVFTWPETTPSATAASLDCPSAGQATRVCSATTLIWETPDTSACSCAAETDSAIDWEDATPSATAQTQACPGGVGDATRVCSTTTFDWETSDVSACKCQADEVTGIVWPESTPDNGNAVQVDCPGGSGTASRICSSTTLNWETPTTGDCKCAAEDASGISWDEEEPSATAQSQNCPGGVGTATRVCSTATLNWAIPTTSACRCAAEENTGIQWTEATPSLTAQSKNCPGGVGTATRECNLTTLVWEDPVVTACKCAAETDPDTGINWPQSSPSDTEVTQDCPSAGDAATRICSTTTLVWEDADLSDCECAGGEYYNVTWATTTPGSNDTNDCPDDESTSAHRYCSDVTYNWEEPDFSGCFCAEDTYDSDAFNRTAAGETFNVTCANGDGHVSRTCNITTGTWDEPIEECGSGEDSPAASIAMPASVSFAVLIAGWLVMH